MSNQRHITQETLQADLRTRLTAALASYAEEHGLTQQEVLKIAREMLLGPQLEPEESS